MFVVIPSAIFILSLIGILYVSLRKLSQASQLAQSQETATVSPTFGIFVREMFPEIFAYFGRVNMPAHKSSMLLEFEKFLRRLRVMFLRFDNLSSNLLHKVRESHLNEIQKAQEKEAQKLEEAPETPVTEIKTTTVDFNTASPVPQPAPELKNKELEIIMAIAKAPKNKALYKELGDLYMELQQWGDARESFMSAIAIDPKVRGVKKKLNLANKMLASQTGSNLNVS